MVLVHIIVLIVKVLDFQGIWWLIWKPQAVCKKYKMNLIQFYDFNFHMALRQPSYCILYTEFKNKKQNKNKKTGVKIIV